MAAKRSSAAAKPQRAVPDEYELVITRVIDAPRALVFIAWTERQHLARWQGAPRGMTVTVHEMDLRPGGSFRICMRSAREGDHWLRGEYREIVVPERIVFTHEWLNVGSQPGKETLVTLTFAERDGKTELTLHQTGFKSAATRNNHEVGWLNTIDRWSEYVGEIQNQQPVIVRVSRGFAASADEVFRAWLNPESIGRWMFGPALRDEEVLHLQVDPRVGGKFSFLVRRQGTEIDHVGTYREIAAPRRLVFTWGIAGQSVEESLVQIDIHPLASGCELTLTHSMHPRWAEYASRTEAGWAKMLAALGNVLPSMDDQNGASARNP